MATTATGRALTEQHRQAQLAIRARFLRELTRLWPMISVDRLDETASLWINAVVDLILAYREQSAGRSLTYYDALRTAEFGEPLSHRALYETLGAPNLGAIRASLLITGPVHVKSLIGKGISAPRATMMALTEVSGAASRHVLNGGRQLLVDATEKDETTSHYARVTGADPCAFCAMLASRGAIYVSRATAIHTTARAKAGAGHQYHDRCVCTVEPSWDRDAPLPGRADEFAKLWTESTGDVSGYSRAKGKRGKKVNNKLKAFRAAYDKQRADSS